MKITLPVAGGQTLEFASLKDLAKHYGTLGDGYRNAAQRELSHAEARFLEGKAEAYDIVCWQLHGTKIEM